MHQHIYQLEIKVRSNKNKHNKLQNETSLFVRLVFCKKNGGIKVHHNLSILRNKFENPKLLLNNMILDKWNFLITFRFFTV